MNIFPSNCKNINAVINTLLCHRLTTADVSETKGDDEKGKRRNRVEALSYTGGCGCGKANCKCGVNCNCSNHETTQRKTMKV